MNNLIIEEKSNKGKTIAKIIVPIVIVVITIILIMFIFKSKKAGQNAGGWGGMPGRNQTVTSVRTIKAENITLLDFVNTNGEVETQTSIDVFPSMSGKVVRLNVSLGSSVRKGQVIAYVDPSEPGQYFANSPVIAPISGSILSSPVRTGQKVTTGTVISRIGDIDNLQITAKIPERYISEVKIGLKAEIKLEAYPDVTFNATVSRISPVVDAATRTKEIILVFDQKDSRINAGMYASVKLYTTEYSGKIAIQQDAFVNNNDLYYLYVVNPDGETVTKRQVTLGKNVNGFYQIMDGINEGDIVVVEGMLTLAEGSKIKDISNNAIPAAKPEADGNAEKKPNQSAAPEKK